MTIDKKTKFDLWNIDSLRYTLALPIYLIFLLLLWHWNYITPFWIFLVLIVIEYLSITYKMNKNKPR